MGKWDWGRMPCTWGMVEEIINAPHKTHKRGRMHKAHEVIADGIERRQDIRRAAGHHAPEPPAEECNWRIAQKKTQVKGEKV